MKIINSYKMIKNGEVYIQNEFNLLKKIDSPYLLKLKEDMFITDDFVNYCIVTEFCEVSFYRIHENFSII
jgi:hypothetical protein